MEETDDVMGGLANVENWSASRRDSRTEFFRGERGFCYFLVTLEPEHELLLIRGCMWFLVLEIRLLGDVGW